MEAFAALRATAIDPPASRPAAAPIGAEFLSALADFDSLIGAQKEGAPSNAPETPADKIAATAPGPRARSAEAEKAASDAVAADPPAIAILAPDLAKPPVTIETSFIRNDDVAEDAEGFQGSRAPATPAGEIELAPNGATTRNGERAPTVATLRILTFIADAGASASAGLAPAPDDRLAPKPDQAPDAEISAPPTPAAPETPAPALKFSADEAEAVAPESPSPRNGADLAPAFAGPAPAEAVKTDTAQQAPVAPVAPLALDGAIATGAAPLSGRAPAAVETPALSFASAAPDAGPAPGRAAPFELAMITRRSDGGLEIRLDPPDLGAVSIQFFEDDAGALQAAITTDRGETLDLLRRHSEFLQRELARQGAGDFTLSFSDRRESGAQANESGVRDRRTIRFGETPEALVRGYAPPKFATDADRIDLIA